MGHHASVSSVVRVACPACHQRLRVPENLAGNRVTCPRCGAAVSVPLPEESPEEAAAAAAHAAGAAARGAEGGAVGDLEHAPPATRMGVVALGLGLLAVLVLCVPLLGYASFALSGLGLLVGLWGLARSLRRGAGEDPAGGPRAGRLGGRVLSYPLAGTLACLVALLLALLPFLLPPAG